MYGLIVPVFMQEKMLHILNTEISLAPIYYKIVMKGVMAGAVKE